MMNRRAQAHPISVVIISASIIVIVMVASVFIQGAMTASGANLELESMRKTLVTLSEIINSISFKINAAESVKMNLRHGTVELANQTTLTPRIQYREGAAFPFTSFNLPTVTTRDMAYVQEKSLVSAPDYVEFLVGDGKLLTEPYESHVNTYQVRNGATISVVVKPRLRIAVQEITLYNNQTVAYVYLYYVGLKPLETKAIFPGTFELKLRTTAIPVLNITKINLASEVIVGFTGLGEQKTITFTPAKCVIVLLMLSEISISGE